MPRIELTTRIHAPIDRVFDLSRSIDLHAASMAHTGEKPIAGVTRGLIGLHEEVTWRAKHFGLWLGLTSRITALQRPTHLRDSMVRGAFRRFDHDHFFHERGNGTTELVDVFDFDAPLGFLGHLANALFLTRYMTALLATRNQAIKAAAEGESWRSFLHDSQ